MAYETVGKQLVLLKRLRVSVIGVIENMARASTDYVRLNVENDGHPHLGELGYDEGIEESLGEVEKLKETTFYGEASKLFSNII